MCQLRRKAERTWRRTRSLSDLNIFKSYRNRVTYVMNQARRAFTLTLLMRIAQTIKDYSEVPNNSLVRKRTFRFLIIRTNKNRQQPMTSAVFSFERQIEFVLILMSQTSIQARAMRYLLIRKQMLRTLFIPFNLSRKTTSLRSSVSLLRGPARWTRYRPLWLLAALTCCCLLFHEL